MNHLLRRKVKHPEGGSTGVAAGLAWTLGEKLLANGFSFLVSLILARLLSPGEYGTVAIAAIFINISNVFIENGFGSALIQKKDADDLDFHTVFLFELAVSVVIYLLIWFLAPGIAGFYEEPAAADVLRIYGSSVVIGSIKNVQHAYVSRRMEFRLFFYSSLGGTLISGAAGVILAFSGCGVWALVAQAMLNSFTDMVILFFTIRWKPKLRFSFQRFRRLYFFGWKIFAAGLLSTLYGNLHGMVIGKAFSNEQLALFNKGNTFPALITNNISGPVNTVTFPALSARQDEPERLMQMTRRTLLTVSFLLWPLLTGMAAAAEPLVELLLTGKWAGCIPFLKINAVSSLFFPVSAANGQVINATGRSDISLKLDVVKKAAGILLLIITLPFGITAMAWGRAAGQLIAAICDIFPNHKLISYGYFRQIRDLLPNILSNAILFSVMRLCLFLSLPQAALLLVQAASGTASYLLCARLFRLEGAMDVREQLARLFMRRKGEEAS